MRYNNVLIRYSTMMAQYCHYIEGSVCPTMSIDKNTEASECFNDFIKDQGDF